MPLSNSLKDIASSKSLASSGSIVKVKVFLRSTLDFISFLLIFFEIDSADFPISFLNFDSKIHKIFCFRKTIKDIDLPF